MKWSLFFIVLFSVQLCFSQRQEPIYLDENGNEIDFYTFRNKWFDNSLLLSRWDSLGKNKIRYAKLNRNLYQAGKYDYGIIKQEVEKIINSKIPENSTILINYIHKDDLCNSKSSNYWSRSKINVRKRWLKPWLEKFIANNLFYISLFENGITLNRKPNLINEIFFTDKSSFFKKKAIF